MTTSFWGPLFTDEEPSPALTRLLDAAFDRITSQDAPPPYPKELTPRKLEWLYEELGHLPSSIPIPVDDLRAFYRAFKIPFVVRDVPDEEGDETTKADCLQQLGWHQLIAVCFFKDPEQAYCDLEQMRAQWDLIDPLSNEPFPSIPRVAAPASPVASYVTSFKQFSQTTPTEPSAVPSGILGLLRSDSPAQESVEDTTTTSAPPGQDLLATLLRHPTRSFTLDIPPSENPPPYTPPAPDSTLNVVNWFEPVLPAPESAEDRHSWYGYLITDQGVSNTSSRLQMVLLETVANLLSPDGPAAGLLTPWTDFLEELIAGASYSEATQSLFDHQSFFDTFDLPYEMKDCTVPDDIKTAFPLLKDVFTACEGPRACLRPLAFTENDWARYSHVVGCLSGSQVGDDALDSINRKVKLFKPIDPIRHQYFPEVPSSLLVDQESSTGFIETLNGWQFETQEKIWGEEVLVKEVDGKFEVSEAFRRFLKIVWDYLLECAPKTSPESLVTILDFWYWSNLFDINNVSKDVERLDLQCRVWEKWGIKIESQQVTAGGRSYGVLPCLTFENWVDAFATMGVYDPARTRTYMRAMCDRWPLFDPITSLRYMIPITANMYPEASTSDSMLDSGHAEALEEWKASPPKYFPLLISKEIAHLVAAEPEASATRLRNMMLEEIAKRQKDANWSSLPKLGADLLGAFR